MTPDDSVTAAELALGLLEGEERADALRRALADRAFAAELEHWRNRFAALFVEVRPIDPPAETAALLAGIGDDRARPWRWATALASALAAGLAVVLVTRPVPVAPPVEVPVPAARPAPLTAAMTPAGKGKPFAALYDAAQGEVRIAAAIEVPTGRVAELWRIGADGVPHSLGVFAGARVGVVTLTPADRAALAAGAILAVSIEPPGGSPKPVPTGPVVATGELVRI